SLSLITTVREHQERRLENPRQDREDERPTDDDDRERLLRLRADPVRQRGRQETEGGDERGHEHGTEALLRRLARRLLDAEALHVTKTLEVGDDEDRILDGDPEDLYFQQRRRHREVHPRDE